MNHPQNKPLYTRFFARDFCLPIIEMWCRAETTDPRQWTNKTNPHLPYQIFIRENGVVTDYLNEDGLTWVKDELKALIKADTEFAKQTVRTFNEKTETIRPIWERATTLSHPELVDYLRRQQDAWAWFEAIWWIMETTPEGTEAFRLAQEARHSTEKMVPNGDILICASLKKLFPELDILSSALTIQEIIDQNPPAREELEKRLERYVFTSGQLFAGERASEMEKRFDICIELLTTKDKHVSEFKGKVAYPGKSRGPVKKVSRREDLANVKIGDVLVSPMTMPEYLPAMQKAAAIITDEGGITCHAAIVARELKKPCIIGTKIATEVLEDGMFVEVDGDTGIVRRING